MAYLRPAMPLEIDPTASAMSDALVFAFGTNGTGLTSFGRAEVTAAPSANVTHGTESITIPQGWGQPRIEIPGAQLSSPVLTTVIVFDKPAGQSFSIQLFNSNNTDTGGGYAVGSLEGNVATDGSWTINRANQANIIIGDPGTFVEGRNVMALTRRADNTIAVSINGGAVVNGPASSYTFGPWSLGTHDHRDKDTSTVTYHWFAHSPTASTDQQLVDLSTNPTMMTRTVGSGATDTTPPTVVSTSTSIYGDSITLTISENVEGYSAFTPNMFSITGDSGSITHNVSSMAFSGATAIIYVSPALGVGENVSVVYTAPDPATGYGIFDPAGNHMESFSIPTIQNDTVGNRPTLTGYEVRVYGDGELADFTTPDEVQAFATTLNCVAAGTKFMLYLDKDLDARNKDLRVANSNNDYFLTIRPMPGKSFDELEPDTAPGAMGTLGINMLVRESNFSQGTNLEAIRINSYSTGGEKGMRFNRGNGNSGDSGGMLACRFRHTGDGAPIETGYGGATVLYADTLFEIDGANTRPLFEDQGFVRFEHNTVVRKNGAVGYKALHFNYDARSFKGNVFSGCGGVPYTGANSNTEKNYTDTAITTAQTGLTYVSGAFFDSATNYRPAAGSALIGAGVYVSRNDNNGNNRGLAPDAGAFQRTPAIPLAKGTLSRYDVDGSSLLVTVDTQNTVDSATISLSAVSGSGGVSVGPLPLTLTTNKADIEIDDIVPGRYNVVILLTNSGGSNPVNGTGLIAINGVGGGTQDPGTASPATLVTLTNTVSTAVAGTPTAPMRLGVNGVHTGNVIVSVTDNDGGVINPSNPTLVNGEAVNFTYTPASAGTKTLVFTNNAGLENPPNLQINVSAAQLPAPTVSISTADVNVLMGSRATVGGAFDLKGDATGTIEVFRDPLPSGTPVKFTGQVNVAGGTWTVQWSDLPAGDFRLRAIATANGQNAVAQTGALRIVPATGVVNVPIA